MQVIRRNSDYALRLMVRLGEQARRQEAGPISARQLAQSEQIPRHFAGKILQQLQGAGLVTSTLGARGGFVLARPAEQISLQEVLAAVQGPISVSDCVFSRGVCPRRPRCTISRRLQSLQALIDRFLEGVLLADLLDESGSDREDERHRVDKCGQGACAMWRTGDE